MSTAIVLIVLVVGVVVGRRAGWIVSEAILYPVPTTISVLLCVAWACAVAYLARRFIEWHQVGLFWKVFIYGAGAYIAVPNYGLFRKNSIPHEIQAKHQAISTFPWVTYIVASVVFAFVVKV
jgi:hypothetical protein